MVLPRSNVTGQVDWMQRVSVFIGTMVVAASLLLGLLLARIISRPITRLSTHVRKIGGGHFDEKIHVQSTAELEQLSNAVNDMTDQLKEQVHLRAAKEAAERANEARSSFFNRVTHELRTPLNAIIGYTEMLDEHPVIRRDPDLRDDLRRVMQASRQLLTLINDLLDLAKAEAGRMRIDYTEFSINDLVREVEETMRPLIEQNHNTLEIDASGVEGPIVSDRGKLRQILLNLLSNAAKFTRNGRIELQVRSDPAHLHFRVSDTGRGIPPEKLKDMFEPFSQADNDVQGTGLGLTISRQLAQMLGGEVELASTVDRGTTADVYLPLRRTRPDMQATIAVAEEK
jgi:signal transduction histidine kinase